MQDDYYDTEGVADINALEKKHIEKSVSK